MLSELAIEDIKGIEADGGKVEPQDVIRLNALGLRINKDPSIEIASLPRLASLEGVQFRQPSVAKDIFLDDCERIFADDDATMLAIEAYVLSHDLDEDWLKHPKLFALKIIGWFKYHFRNTTATQVRRVVDFCLYGIDETTGETPIMMFDDKADKGNDRLGGDFSWALANYLTSVSIGIDSVAALRSTSPQLSAMIERAYAVRGVPLKKNEAELTGQYYSTLSAIRERSKRESQEVK